MCGQLRMHLGEARAPFAWKECTVSASATSSALLGAGYLLPTVSCDTQVSRKHIMKQERENERLDQIGLWRRSASICSDNLDMEQGTFRILFLRILS